MGRKLIRKSLQLDEVILFPETCTWLQAAWVYSRDWVWPAIPDPGKRLVSAGENREKPGNPSLSSISRNPMLVLVIE
jgi:hypothetical protein